MHSSPSFRSWQVCSHSNPSHIIRVSRRCNPQGDPINQLSCALWVFSLVTHTHVRFLGLCFNTGRMGSLHADAWSTHLSRGALNYALSSIIMTITFPRAFQQFGLGPPSQSASINASNWSEDLSPLHIRWRHIVDPFTSLPIIQALFDSLLKVLFIFLSRYLFAIDSRFREW